MPLDFQAYVTQDDNLIGTLTVRETISYSARLRLPDKMSWSDKRALVESTIVEMGLQDCADTVIGNWHLRGISGGEKRRVSIALEILMRPRLLFLDEPTSGLDSASAFFVTQTLRGLSRDGRTFFAQAGFPCPALRNPSDHFLRDDPLEKVTTAEAIRALTDYYRTSHYCYAANEKVEEMSKIKGTVLDSGGSQASFFMQSFMLTKRSFVNMSRDFGYYWLRLVIYILVTVCIGSIYFNVGTGYNSILARGACASFVFGFVTFMSIGGFPSFVEDMKVFQRERLNGHYGVTAFVISNTISAMPFLILIAFISGTICYFMVRLHPGFLHYLFFVLCLYSSVTVVESLMMAIASVVPNFLMGIIIGAGIQGIFMLVSGYFRLPNDIPKPVWRYPMSYISFHFWALQGQFQNDLSGLLFDNQTPDLPQIPGEYILEYVFQITVTRSKWIDLGVIFSMIIVYRLIFFCMIKINEDLTPWVRGYLARKRMKQKSGGQNTTVAPYGLTQSPSLRNYVADNRKRGQGFDPHPLQGRRSFSTSGRTGSSLSTFARGRAVYISTFPIHRGRRLNYIYRVDHGSSLVLVHRPSINILEVCNDTVNIQLSTSSTLLQNYLRLSSLISGPDIRCNPAGLYCHSDAGSLLLPPLIRRSATPQTQE
ncbi:ABC transporter G family member 11 [Tanacetum coccineum]